MEGLGFPPQQHHAPCTPFLLLLPTSRFKKWGIYALEHSCCHGVMREGSMEHHPNKDRAASGSSPFRSRGSGEGDATEPRPGKERWEKQRGDHKAASYLYHSLSR